MLSVDAVAFALASRAELLGNETANQEMGDEEQGGISTESERASNTSERKVVFSSKHYSS